MFSHLVLGADDIPAAKTFYDAALGALGQNAGVVTPDGNRLIYQGEAGILMITKPLNGESATFANGGTVGLSANSAEVLMHFTPPDSLRAVRMKVNRVRGTPFRAVMPPICAIPRVTNLLPGA